MSVEDFDRFRELVVSDPALRDELRGIRDSAALRERTLALGRERNFDFCEADIETVVNNMKRAWLERWLHQ